MLNDNGYYFTSRRSRTHNCSFHWRLVDLGVLDVSYELDAEVCDETSRVAIWHAPKTALLPS